jgi:hypothetical protein
VCRSWQNESWRWNTYRLQNEHLLLSHFHDPQDGYLNVELDDEWISDDQGSVTSVIRKTEGQPSREHRRKHVISEDVSSEPTHFQLKALANK